MTDDHELLDEPDSEGVEGTYIRWLGEPEYAKPVAMHDVMGQPMTIEQLAARVRRAQDEELGYGEA